MKNKKGISTVVLAYIGLAVVAILMVVIFSKMQDAFMGGTSSEMGYEAVARQRCISSFESWRSVRRPEVEEGGYWYGLLCTIQTEGSGRNLQTYTCCGNFSEIPMVLDDVQCTGLCPSEPE